jgi:hypothetical protein
VNNYQTVLDNNKSELVYYIARQAVTADRGARISFWASVFFILSVIYSIYRSRKEREFRKTVFSASPMFSDGSKPEKPASTRKPKRSFQNGLQNMATPRRHT